MPNHTIGLGQRIPIALLEMALQSWLTGRWSAAYAQELAATNFTGARSIEKTARTIGQLTARNPYAGYLKAHSAEVLSALHSPADRTLVLAALITGRYEFAYDVLCILGRLFHAQDLIPTALIARKAAEKYMAGEKMLTNALHYLLPMLCEAGLLLRPKVGQYAIRKVTPQTAIAVEAFQKAFLQWNPTLNPEADMAAHPYYEFIR